MRPTLPVSEALEDTAILPSANSLEERSLGKILTIFEKWFLSISKGSRTGVEPEGTRRLVLGTARRETDELIDVGSVET